jgi:hypothetical protein
MGAREASQVTLEIYVDNPSTTGLPPSRMGHSTIKRE